MSSRSRLGTKAGGGAHFACRSDAGAFRCGRWGQYAAKLADPQTGLFRQPGNGGHDDKAHPPIHPTRWTAGEGNWSEPKKRLYELICRHFLACCSRPATGFETTMQVQVAGEGFHAKGLMVSRGQSTLRVFARACTHGEPIRPFYGREAPPLSGCKS